MKDLLVRLGLAALARPLLGGRGTVLVFHRLGPHDASLRFEANHRNTIPVALFERLLDTLAADGVEVVTLDEALARMAAPRSARFACLTFDDGYRDNHDLLLPVLEARRLPATIYIAPGLVDGTAPLWWYALDEVIAREDRVSLPLPEETALPAGDAAAKERAFTAAARVMLGAPPAARAALLDALATRYGADPEALAARHMMDWAMIRRLAASPFVEIGAHTLSHPPLATLDAAAAAAEMTGSRNRLERETGREVRHFAFPYGVPGTTGPREWAMARDLGFRTAVTTLPGNLLARHAGAPQAWPRHGVAPFDGPAALRLKLAGIANPLRAARADR